MRKMNANKRFGIQCVLRVLAKSGPKIRDRPIPITIKIITIERPKIKA